MAKQTSTEFDPREYEKSVHMWRNFMRATKWVVIGVVVIFSLMALVLL